MKKLVLGSLLLAALISQTTGCIITSSDDVDDEFATINAEWSFHEVDASGRPVVTNPCPAGFDTVALHNQQFDPATGRDLGSEVIDLFDCVDMRNFTDELVPGVYETFLSVTSPGGASIYATSLAATVDVTTVDKTFSSDIVDNGGYFKVGWDLRRTSATGTLLACRDVANIDGVEITATLSGSSAAVTDTFDCEPGVDFSAAVMEGTYVVKVDAINTSNQAIGAGELLNNKVMRDRNQVTDLGIVTLVIP
ncbi:MAG TPA: hypothetical protein VNO30_39865 [Kofleriaceae bacterium]|nr:hypothetical protein [Kofleriaceae bacterium]